MAKAFKILVDIIIVLCLVAVAALLVPPLVGVKTEVAGPAMDRNIKEGTVTYGVRRPAVTLEKGNQIIYSGDDYLYLYDVEDVNADTSEVSVIDPATSESLVLEISKNATKKVLVIPYMGYILIALNSSNGLAILISAAVALAALYVLATLLYKRTKAAKGENKKGYNNEDEEYFTALAKSVDQPNQLDEIKRRPAAAAASAASNSPTNEIPDVSREIPQTYQSSSEISQSAAAGVVASDGMTRKIHVDSSSPASSAAAGVAAAAAVGAAGAAIAGKKSTQEVIEEDTIPEYSTPVGSISAQGSADLQQGILQEEDEELPNKLEPDRFTTENISEAFENIPEDTSPATLDIAENEIPDVSVALVAALETTQVSRSDRAYQTSTLTPIQEPVAEEEEPDEIELAIPVKTANEILDEAYAKGYDPQVITDDVTGVKLVDFSDCF